MLLSKTPPLKMHYFLAKRTRRQHHLLVVAQMEFLEEMEVGMKVRTNSRKGRHLSQGITEKKPVI